MGLSLCSAFGSWILEVDVVDFEILDRLGGSKY